LVVGLVGVLVAVVGLVPASLSTIEDSRAERERARAERIDAQARADHLDAEDFQRSFMLWSTMLQVNKGDGVLLLVVGLVALAGGFAWGRAKTP